MCAINLSLNNINIATNICFISGKCTFVLYLVQVNIFVEGVLDVDKSTTDPLQKAIAQGNF